MFTPNRKCNDLTNISQWTTWSMARGYPLTSSEEAALIIDLEKFEPIENPIDDSVITSRNNISLLMTILRDGSSIKTCHEIAPNINPADLLAAYNDIRKKLENAKAAWQRILCRPDTYEENKTEAYKVLPHIINAVSNAKPCERQSLLAEMAELVASYTDHILSLEETCIDITNSSKILYSLGKSSQPLWDHNFFLPNRVGQLTPTRLAFLLGETTIEDK